MIAVIMSWEWAHLVRSVTFDLTLIIQGLAVASAIAPRDVRVAALGVAVLIIGAIIVAALEFGKRPIYSRGRRSLCRPAVRAHCSG